MSRRAQADVNPDTANAQKLLRAIVKQHKAMVDFESKRDTASKEVDRLADELNREGWTFQAVADLLKIDRRNLIGRAQRHRGRVG